MFVARIAPLVLITLSVIVPTISSSPLSSDKISAPRWPPSSVRLISDQHRRLGPRRRRRNKDVVKFDDDDDTNENDLLISGSSEGGQRSNKAEPPIDRLLADKYQPQVMATLVDSLSAPPADHPADSFGGGGGGGGDHHNMSLPLAGANRRSQVTRRESPHRKEGPFSLDGRKQEEWSRNRQRDDGADFSSSTPASSVGKRKPQQQRHNNGQQVVVSGDDGDDGGRQGDCEGESRADNKGAGGVEKPQVLLARDVSVRSDLLFIRTSNASSAGAVGIDGLPSRNLSGSVEVPAQVWTRRSSQPVAPPAPHRRLVIELGAARLEPVNQEEPEEEPPEEPPEEGLALARDEATHAQLRTAPTSSSADIRVSDGTRGLVINHRGLVMAAKRDSHRPPYNFSALYANHVDHSLSPTNKSQLLLQLADQPVRSQGSPYQLPAPTQPPAFLHQRPPTVSSIIWRNTSSRPPKPDRTYHLIGGSVDGGPAYLVPGSKFNPTSIFTDLAVSELDRDQSTGTTTTSTTSTTTTTRRPALETEHQLDGRGGGGGNRTTSGNQNFHHNPPYRHQQSQQQQQQSQLDLAATQQIVQAYDNKSLFLASVANRRKQNINKHPETSRPAYSSPSRPSTIIDDHHQQATLTPSNAYDTTRPPFELNQTISSSLNAPLAASVSSSSNHSSSSSRPQAANSNGKLMSKLQHMIIGKILKQQSSGAGNMSSAGSSLVPTTLAQWPSTGANNPLPSQQAAGSLPTTTNVTPPPLLSTTVANNVANLIAQKLSTLFTKPQPPPTSTHHGPSGLGLSSLFGYRVGAHNGGKPVKQRLNPVIQTAHSPLVNRRTAGMGSILVSGLIYGLSVLPALMALTGVNPLAGSGQSSGNSGGQQDQIATSGSSYSFSIRPPRVASRRTTTTVKPSTTKGDGSNKLQDAYAYLVPVMSAIANSLDDDDIFNSADSPTAQQTALKQLYAPSPTVIDASDAIPVHLLDTSLQADSLAGLANHPLSFLPSLNHHQPYHHQHNRQHHYPYAASVYEDQLHYSSPLVGPSSSNNPWQHTRHFSSHQNSWQRPITTTTTSTTTSTTPSPESFEHTTFRSVRNYKTKRRDLHSSGSSPHSSLDERTASPGSANRAYRVGYTLNYKPLVAPPTAPQADRQQQYIEFQSVNDMDQLVDQWRPIQVPVASSRSSEGEAKYNLNQGLSRLMREDFNSNQRRLAKVDEPSHWYNSNQSHQRLRNDVGGVFTRYVRQPTNDDDR